MYTATLHEWERIINGNTIIGQAEEWEENEEEMYITMLDEHDLDEVDVNTLMLRLQENLML